MSVGTSPKAPPPTPADVGVVAAMAMEVQPFLDRLTNVRKYAGPRFTVIEGMCGGKLVALVLTGMGRLRAQRGAEVLLDGHRPRWIISAGYGGALDLDLRRNEIVLPDEVVNVEGRRFAIGVSVPTESRAQGVRSGRLLTVDEVFLKASKRAELRREYAADVVDMETSAVAALCEERNIRFLPVRVISDEAGVDLPPEILAIVGPTGGLRLGATVGALWKRPSSVKDLLVLRRHATEAADRLGNFLVGTIPRLN